MTFVRRPGDSASASNAASLEETVIATDERWEVVHKSANVTVLHRPMRKAATIVHHIASGSGVILGSLFRRSRTDDPHSPVGDLGATESRDIVLSAGRHLITNYWGSYIAVVCNSEAGICHILRDPTANMPCYRARCGNVDIVFSDVCDFAGNIPISLSVDWAHIAAALLAGSRISRQCALREIEDIPGGERITYSQRGAERMSLWHPAQFCFADDLEDEAKAARELRTNVFNVVHALASQHSDILIRLSGGLDSSIVTTCVAQLSDRPTVTCLNYYIPRAASGEQNSPLPFGFSQENLAKVMRVIGSADERDFARSVTRKTGFRLLEVERRAGDVDLRRIWDAPLTPRPTNYTYVLIEDHAELECVAATGATACFTGEAGDTVFYCTQRAIGAVDYAYLHPFGPRALHHIATTARLSGESLAHVLGKVLKYSLLRLDLPPPYEPMARPHLLADDVAGTVQADFFGHPWVDLALHLCPGKRNHVSGLVDSALFYPYVQHRDGSAPSVRPLASQPVVETCLRIPSYVLLAGGVSRGLARRAFSDLLPPEVARRTVKGLTLGFWQTVVRRSMPLIRECLIDGELVKRGLLSRRKLNEYLVDDQPFVTVGPDQLLDYMACEAWLSRWRPDSLRYTKNAL